MPSYYNNSFIIPKKSRQEYAIIHSRGGTILLTKAEFMNAKKRANKFGYNK